MEDIVRTNSIAMRDIHQLVSRAKNSKLGIDFLQDGDLEAVAITFETTVFVVSATRDFLNKEN